MASKLTPQATALLAEMARDHGLSSLEPNDDGLIPITLDDGFVFTLAFDGVNNAVFVMTVLATADAADVPDWPTFGWNAGTAERRTRIARAPDGALVLIRDMPLTGLEYWSFAKGLETFVSDASDAAAAIGLGPAPAATGGDGLTAFSPDEMVIIRP